MRILVDMDGVIADWGNEFNRNLDLFGEAARNIPRHEDQVTFDLNAGRTDEEKTIIARIMREPGFYSNLTMIPGARSVLRKMLALGHDVRIVTSPWVSNPTCASDKLNWVLRNYGDTWAQRVIITTDKTLVKGDILIDDKPAITGQEESPSWVHVLFGQPYNQGINKPRIMSWEDCEYVINNVTAK